MTNYDERIRSQTLSEKASEYAEQKLLENDIRYPDDITGLKPIEIYAKQQLYVNKQMFYRQEYMLKHCPELKNKFSQNENVSENYKKHAYGIDYAKKNYGKVTVRY